MPPPSVRTGPNFSKSDEAGLKTKHSSTDVLARSDHPWISPAALRNLRRSEAHNNLGAALLETPGRIPSAIEQFQSALRSRPDYEEARNNLAIAFSRTPGRTADAVAQFELALRLAPDDADAHYNLGTLLARIPGRVPEAIAHLETALRLRPDSAPARQWLDHLRATGTSGTP